MTGDQTFYSFAATLIPGLLFGGVLAERFRPRSLEVVAAAETAKLKEKITEDTEAKVKAAVQATRARHGTDWHLARDQLGEEGQDPDRITRLAQRISNSRLQAPSIDYRELPGPTWRPSRDPLHLRRLLPDTSWLVRAPRRDTTDRSIERGR